MCGSVFCCGVYRPNHTNLPDLAASTTGGDQEDYVITKQKGKSYSHVVLIYGGLRTGALFKIP